MSSRCVLLKFFHFQWIFGYPMLLYKHCLLPTLQHTEYTVDSYFDHQHRTVKSPLARRITKGSARTDFPLNSLVQFCSNHPRHPSKEPSMNLNHGRNEDPSSWKSDHDGRLLALIDISQRAGRHTLNYFRCSDLIIDAKADDSPVTVADREAELDFDSDGGGRT